MLFRVTRKLAKKLKLEPIAALPPADNPLLDWTANLFMVGRQQYIIVTNSTTLYTVLIPGRGNASGEAFAKNALTEIRAMLENDELSPLGKSLPADPSENLVFCRASDRHVLGSMNDFVFITAVTASYSELMVEDSSEQHNQAPMKMIGYRHPIDLMRKLLSTSAP